ncbi:hypothetical protein ACHWQZ_G017898 [Mnemiopsis leidyi]
MTVGITELGETSHIPLVETTDVTIGLLVNCSCLGSQHRPFCQLVSRLPVKTNSKPGKLFLQIGTIKNVKNPNEVYYIKFPVCYQFNIMIQSPIYNKVDSYGESLAYSHVVLPHYANIFVKRFIDKIARKYKEEVTLHKSFKLFLADNASSVKQAIHCDPFTLTVGGFCAVERSDDFTVDFMNKRKYIWAHSLTAADGAELNMGVWERNSTYHRAKQIVRRFLWVVVVLGLLVPLAVHNMRDHDAECIRQCCQEDVDCLAVRKYWKGIIEEGAINASSIFANFSDVFSLADFARKTG